MGPGRSAECGGKPKFRLTLGSRVLAVMVSIASVSTLITVLLQDNGLSADLEKATRSRLTLALGTASQLLEETLAAQSQRYRAISSTPQLQANLEARHAPTLRHYSSTLLAQQHADAILFLDPTAHELAGSGAPGLRAKALDWARATVQAAADSIPDAGRWSMVLAHDGGLYTAVRVPLAGGAEPGDALLALELIREPQLTAWSKLCRARVFVGPVTVPHPHPTDDTLSMSMLAVGPLELRVATTFAIELEALANSRRNLFAGGLLGLAIALAASVFFARSLVRPIKAIQQATVRIGDGDLEVRLAADRTDEVGDVARALNLMLERLEQNIEARIRVQNHVRHLALHDSLTGLGNRRSLEDRIGSALEKSRQSESNVAVVYLDLDRFKDINDVLGHSAGDELLQKVGRRLDACVRTAGFHAGDTEELAFLARLGGDEFSLVLADFEGREQLEVLAQRILDSFGMPFQLREHEVNLSASLGIALSPDDAQDVESLMRDSDMAMFHAKQQGGKGYQFYADSMQEHAIKRLALENKMRRAIEAEEFELYYQPKLDLATNSVRGVEALVRWQDPELGMVGPDEFIPSAEETGAIDEIGRWVLRTAVEQCLSWQQQGLPPVRVAVNVSARQLDRRYGFVRAVADALEDTGLDPKLLDLELTEGVVLQDEERAIEMLLELQNLGVGLSMDDFGTGYSSLSCLRRLPFDTVKIDRAFVQSIETNPQDAALVGSIISMAKVLKLKVVVEGVETPGQRTLIENTGCDEIQGYLFCKPVCSDEIAEVLRWGTTREPKAPPAPRKRKKATKKPARKVAKKAVKASARKSAAKPVRPRRAPPA